MHDAEGYRADIDGLRALAVALVVIFHFFPTAVSGGFIGVDIFFVISGYLISRHILIDLSLERFSLAAFYARRVRRIFPALILTLTAVTLAGWLLLTPHEYELLGRPIAGGAAFAAGAAFLANGAGTCAAIVAVNRTATPSTRAPIETRDRRFIRISISPRGLRPPLYERRCYERRRHQRALTDSAVSADVRIRDLPRIRRI